MFTPRHLLPLLLLAFAPACGGSSPGDGPDGPGPDGDSTVRALIGPAGGTLVSRDGKATLVVPPGALDQETELSVAPGPAGVDPAKLVGGALYNYGPDGLHFHVPAELTIQYDPSQRPSGTDEAGLLLVKHFDDGANRFHRTELDLGLHAATATIPGFSHYGVACCFTADPPHVAADIGADRKVTLHFSWAKPERADELVIERAKNNIFTARDEEYVVIHGRWPAHMDYVDAGVNGPAAIYHYRVRNLVGVDMGWPSNEAYVADFGNRGPPSAPSNFRAVARSNVAIDLSWSAGASVLFYRLERETGGGNFSAVATLPFDAPAYSDSGLTPDTDYQYRVRAENNLGMSPWSYVTARTALTWSELGTPLNQDSASMASKPSLAFDTSGALYAAWSELSENGGGAYVSRFDGASWQVVSGGPAISGLAEEPLIAFDPSGALVLAASLGGEPAITRWDGTRWTPQPGDTLSGPAGDYFASSFSLAVAPTGQVYLAFDERMSGTSQAVIQVVRATGTGYDRLPMLQSAGEVGSWPGTPSVAAGPDGNPVVAYVRGSNQGEAHVIVARFDGNQWQSSTPLNTDPSRAASSPHLVLDATGAPIVTFLEYNGTAQGVQVRRWSVDHYEALPIANVNPARYATGPHLALDPSGAPVVTFTEQGTSLPQSLIYTRRFDGTNWSGVGDTVIDVHAYAMVPVIAISASGGIAVGWLEQDSQGTTALAKVSGFAL